MRNFIQPGETITLVAPAEVKSGDVVVVGGLAGVAATDAAEGAEVETQLVGVFELPKGADVLAAGALVCWDGAKVVAAAGRDVGCSGPSSPPPGPRLRFAGCG